MYSNNYKDERLLARILGHYEGELLWHKLILYFERRRIRDAEELAQEVLIRVSEKLDRGVEIADLTGYAFGVARLVLYEELRKKKNGPQLIFFSDLSKEESRDVHLSAQSTPDPIAQLEQVESYQWLEDCLRALSPEDRELLLNYTKCASKSERDKLAADHGLSGSAMRVKVHRIRAHLRQLIRRKSDSANTW